MLVGPLLGAFPAALDSDQLHCLGAFLDLRCARDDYDMDDFGYCCKSNGTSVAAPITIFKYAREYLWQ